MKRYLLAAEADQIQDSIFRAAHLREVVGASQILSRFGDRENGAPAALQIPDKDLVVSGGGSFRVLFDDQDQARRFGAHLAQVYRQATNSSLTVIDAAEPVDVDDSEDFRRAGKAVQEKLREAKRHKRGKWTTPQLPYVAFCASCGVGLSLKHTQRHDEESQEQYLCEVCLSKGAERTEKSLGEFLGPFVQAVVGKSEDLDQYVWPGKKKGRKNVKEEIDPTADIGQFDSRQYVAYLLADGNNMGQVFDQCDKEQMRDLSEGLTETLRASLAAATIELTRNQPDFDPNFVPVLPLILGGDDLFALLPAPWALDFARHFCLQFEEKMTHLVDELELPDRDSLPERVTAGACVVICKANYPFYLAHSIGEERLNQSKQLTKRLAKNQKGYMRSVVDFEIILGSQAGAKPSQGEYRSTLRPYWVTGDAVPEGWGVKLDAVLNQRLELHVLPKKRLSQLRALYYPSCLPKNRDDLPRWEAQRDALFQRIEREPALLQRVRDALEDLGGADWHASRRTASDDWHGHGLPDLLEAWDFAYRLDKPRQDYEEV